MKTAAQEARARYERHYKSGRLKEAPRLVIVPENVERREVHEPCFMCGTAGGCRHRPWMLA